MKPMRVLLLAIGFGLIVNHVAQAAEPAPRVSYVALSVFDEKRALDFYVGALGMTERRRIVPNAAITEILLGFTQNPDDAGVLLMLLKGRDKPYEMGDGFSRFIVAVPNLDHTVKRLADAGVKLTRPITNVDGLQLRYAMVKDPDGYLIELVQHL